MTQPDESEPTFTPDEVLMKRSRLGVIAAVCSALAIVVASIIVGSNGFFLIAGLPIVVAAGVGGFIALRKYYRLTFAWQTRSRRPYSKPDLEVDTEEIRRIATSIYDHLEVPSVVVFHDLLVTPANMVERITESVEPLSRSTLVRSTHTLVFPEYLSNVSVVVPVHRQAKDQLGAGMRFYGDDEKRLSSLSQKLTLAYTAANIRFLALCVSPAALRDYIRYLENDVIAGLAAFPGSAEVTRLRSKQFEEQLYALNTLGQSDAVFALRMIERIIGQFMDNRIVCIQFNVPKIKPKSSPFALHVRLTSEVRLPPRIRLNHSSKTRAQRLRALVTEARRWIGVRPSVVYFRLSNADRASSYHVQVKGPDGTYLGWQELIDATTAAPVDHTVKNYAMSPRRGQRHSHLYIHGGDSFSKRVYVNHFFERMPGSMGSATMSAVAAALLIWLCAFVSLNRGELSANAPIGGSDLVAVLLAFPVVIALWVGVDRQQTLVGDVMVAKVAKLFTVVLCVVAAYFYVLSAPSSEEQTGAWVWIAGLASFNMLACCASWYLRARVHDHFIRASEDA